MAEFGLYEHELIYSKSREGASEYTMRVETAKTLTLSPLCLTSPSAWQRHLPKAPRPKYLL